jgi:hypothetical protein
MMVHEGTRRCDLCASEILGHGGTDICLICRLDMEAVAELSHQPASERWQELEGFLLTAVIGRSHTAGDHVVAANDAWKKPLERSSGGGRSDAPARMVQRLAAGLTQLPSWWEYIANRR